MSNLKLHQLYLGKTDAKDELIFSTTAERKIFEDSFSVPNTVAIPDFLDGRRFFILGLKGTGKTALLRYLDLKAQQSAPKCTRFILFKSQMKEQERREFAQNQGELEVVDDTRLASNDYEDQWRWLLHSEVVDLLDESRGVFVEEDSNYEKYRACVLAFDSSNRASGLKKLLPKLSKGQVEISKNASLKIDFEWVDKEKTRVQFGTLVRQADELFSRLRPLGKSIYIFIDELELKLGSKKQFQRDAKLIRDAIIAVREMNELSQKCGRWLKIITAVRSEVRGAVASLGKEIDKPLTDFGRELSWYEGIKDGYFHPLVELICRKIMWNEKNAGIASTNLSRIWTRYFVYKEGEYSQRELLHRTWFRPRDLIRLLSFVQERHPNDDQFESGFIDQVMRRYSAQSWRELATDLNVKYDASQISGINLMFTQFRQRFTFDDFTARLSDLSTKSSDVASLKQGFLPVDILNDLFRVGAIGNIGQEGVRFAFREDSELNVSAPMGVHKGLWSYFSLFTPVTEPSRDRFGG